jgi:diguanylate cyclase (GGDEF)-like protein
MIEAAPFPQEEQRVNALKKIRMLDTPIEQRFERLTRMVCRLMDVPISIFNLIDDQEQFYKSAQGINAVRAPREGAFCTHAFHEPDMLLLNDASKDDRFHDNPFVTGEIMNIGFYAGCAVKTPDGMPVGTLCAIDLKPREMTPDQLQTLRDISAMVETELKLAYMQHDKKELESSLEQANRLAMIDPMTRLWNRLGMEAMMNKEWAEARRYKRPLTIVMCDIDHFKKINDTYGHDVGDDVIRTAGKKLLENLRTEDHICRVGGEEFLMILPNCTINAASELLERTRKTVEKSRFSDTHIEWPVTMSFGATTIIPDMNTAPAAAIKRADQALYEAKNSGRNCVIAAK